MNAKQAYFTILASLGTAVVRGCSPMPPCGYMSENLKLTNVTGVLHIDIYKYEDCDYFGKPNPYGGEKVTIEVDVESNTILAKRDEPLEIAANDELFSGLRDTPAVDQSGIEIIPYKGDSFLVMGEKFRRPRYVLNLSGFVRPTEKSDDGGLLSFHDDSGVISFYSERMKRIYFIYGKNGKNKKNTISSCAIDNELSCMTTKTKLDFHHVNTDNKYFKVKVYDSIQLVGLPTGTDTGCGGYKYYSFDQDTLVKSVDTLNGNIFAPIEVDSRIGVAYTVEGGRERGFKIRSEKIVKDLDVSSKNKNKMKVNRKTLKGLFSNLP